MQILIVDDCPDMIELISEYLADNGHSTISADFTEAGNVFNKNPKNFKSVLINFDLRFDDQIFNLQDSILEENPETPIVYLTNSFELAMMDQSRLKTYHIINGPQLFFNDKFVNLVQKTV